MSHGAFSLFRPHPRIPEHTQPCSIILSGFRIIGELRLPEQAFGMRHHDIKSPIIAGESCHAVGRAIGVLWVIDGNGSGVINIANCRLCVNLLTMILKGGSTLTMGNNKWQL